MQDSTENKVSNEINERIDRLLKHYKLNKSQFSKRVGISNSMAVNLVGGRLSKPSYELTLSIATAFPDVSVDWLITGRGEMITSGQNIAGSAPQASLSGIDEATHLNTHLNTHLISKSSPIQPDLSTTTVQKAQKARNVLAGLNSGPSFMPVQHLAGVRVSAGHGSFTSAVLSDTTTSFMLPGLSRGTTYLGVLADGDSMSPTIYDRDYLIISEIQKLDNLRENSVCVVLTGDVGYVKRVSNRIEKRGSLLLRSDNPRHTTFELPIEEVVQVFYVHLRITAQFPSELRDLHQRVFRLEEAYLTNVGPMEDLI